MPKIASSALTFLDTTDQNQLSAYLSSNYALVQTCTSNGKVYNPSWSAAQPLEIQLNAFFDQTEIDYTNTDYVITWYVQDGVGSKQEIGQGTRMLKITENALGQSETGMLTYSCQVKLDDVNVIETQITYTLIGEAKSVVFSVYAPDGTVFLNQSGQLTLATNKYYGPNEITSGATFKWEKYQGTDWTEIAGEEDDVLTVNGSDVINIASYRCIMTYNGVDYIGVVTLEDKSDPYISEIYTIGGTVFKNGIGGSAAYVIVRSNGKEVDELAGSIGTTAPPSPVKNDYWYEVKHNGNKIVYKKYNGTSWVEVSAIEQNLKYTWTLLDETGKDIAFNDGSEEKTGKVIYLSCADISNVGILQCNVEQE